MAECRDPSAKGKLSQIAFKCAVLKFIFRGM